MRIADRVSSSTCRRCHVSLSGILAIVPEFRCAAFASSVTGATWGVLAGRHRAMAVTTLRLALSLARPVPEDSSVQRALQTRSRLTKKAEPLLSTPCTIAKPSITFRVWSSSTKLSACESISPPRDIRCDPLPSSPTSSKRIGSNSLQVCAFHLHSIGISKGSIRGIFPVEEVLVSTNVR